MEWYKGITICYLRDQLRAKRPSAEQELLTRMDEETRQVYLRAIPAAWLNIHASARIVAEVSQALYPQVPDAILQAGRAQAKDNLTGIYRVLLKVASVQFALKQAAQLWATYHRKGEAVSVPGAQDKSAILSATGYPELPEVLRHYITGYIPGVLELAKADVTAVHERFDNPQAWQWEFQWR